MALPEVEKTTGRDFLKAVAGTGFYFAARSLFPDQSLQTYDVGIAEAAEEAGAKVLYVNDVTKKIYPQISIRGAQVLKNSSVNRYVLESDVLINIPVAKVHSSAGLTIVLKNLMGVTGDNRSKWHWELHQSISDFSLGVKTHFTVVDATSIMIKNGPTGGRPEYLKRLDTVIASADLLSADAAAAGLFGIAPSRIGYMTLAHEKGIGKLKGYSVGRSTV
jgi:uncharacterized protein (DUF362 family)